MKKIAGILILMFFFTQINAQRKCASVDYTKQLVANNPAIQISINQAEQQIITTLAKNSNFLGRDTTANEIINIPVVVHVLYKTAEQNISTAQILSQLEALNNDFSNLNADKANTPSVFKSLAADSKLKFCLAQVDAKGARTTGIIRKYTSAESFTADDAMKNTARAGDDAWDSKKYLNIWVCSLGGRSLGYATPPGGPADKDGIVIAFDVFGTVGNVRSPFNKGRTATHEVGHWLGLKHLWGDSECGSDGVDDTPSQKTYNFGCPSFPNISSCSPNANGDMFMNYMDFSDDACMNMFTIGQKKRMRALFANGNLRNSFLVSFACDSNLVQAGPLPTPAPVPVPVVTVSDIVKVYPNPSQSYIVVEVKPATIFETTTIRIYNIMGVMVYKGQLATQKSNVNVSGFSTGNYIVKIGADKDGLVSKFYKL